MSYVVQLKIDSDPEAQLYLAAYEPDREQIHTCLGCDSCLLETSPRTISEKELSD